MANVDDDEEWDWVEDAREEVRDSLQKAQFDDATGILTIKIDDAEQDFDNLSDLTRALEQFVESELDWRRPDDAEESWDEKSETIVEEELETSRVLEFFGRLRPDQERQLQLSFGEVRETTSSNIIRVDLEQINEELIRYLAAHPNMLHELSPFKFEDLICELFRDLGYEVVPTPRVGDGGFDFKAFQKDRTGTICTLTLVECKRYKPTRPVAVEVVRRMRGILDTNNATNGVIVATTRFTRGAKAEQALTPHRLALGDFEKLQAWLRSYRMKPPA